MHKWSSRLIRQHVVVAKSPQSNVELSDCTAQDLFLLVFIIVDICLSVKAYQHAKVRLD